MKILSAEQLKEADKQTIANQGISSLELMEQAAELLSQWFCNNLEMGQDLLFFIGKGGNGGDGLAVARMLANVGFKCSVLMCYEAKKNILSSDTYANYKRLPSSVQKFTDVEKVPFSSDTVIVDAMLGVGFNGELQEPISSYVELINALENRVVSIDIPSGIPAEGVAVSSLKIEASDTLTLFAPKLNLLLPEYGNYSGNVYIIDLELDIENISSNAYYIAEQDIVPLVMKRKKFSYKNEYGHALLIAGSQTMMGAASLALGSALRSGVGLVTLHIPYSQRFAIQANYPSSILSFDKEEYFSCLPLNLSNFSSVGVGCGLGVNPMTVSALSDLLKEIDMPMVIDADALNILSFSQDMLKDVPEKSILTPHVGELKRLIGDWENEQDKIDKVKNFAAEIDSIIILKGAHTMITCPDGRVYFNSSGTPALAKAGSGDVLCGFITGLLARGYNPLRASLLGVYLHGKAGEKAADYHGVEAVNSSDLIDFLAEAYAEL